MIYYANKNWEAYHSEPCHKFSAFFFEKGEIKTFECKALMAKWSKNIVFQVNFEEVRFNFYFSVRRKDNCVELMERCDWGQKQSSSGIFLRVDLLD